MLGLGASDNLVLCLIGNADSSVTLRFGIGDILVHHILGVAWNVLVHSPVLFHFAFVGLLRLGNSFLARFLSMLN